MSVPTLSQIVGIADRLFPFQEAEPWDNVGIQIGTPDRVIDSIAFSLDPTPQTVEFAARNSCQLLVTHHPVLLEPIRSIKPDNLSGRTFLAAARLGVDILSLHTNLDAAPGGLNDYVARAMDLQEVRTPFPARCARLGRLPEALRVCELAGQVAERLMIPHVRIITESDCQVELVFSATGSGMGYLREALEYGADVMVTGDVKYHAAREAMELGMPVIDAGHYGLEKMAITLMVESFQTHFMSMGLNVKCLACDSEKEPFLHIYDLEEDISVERANTAS
ncbi:MAG: Nif3-like dinuclear metal center hexameric protein [Desulfomonile tiedjei]|nr:Nif3-like dinuclear metal center hexameric protein [Desulfomonile tiedjei]